MPVVHILLGKIKSDLKAGLRTNEVGGKRGDFDQFLAKAHDHFKKSPQVKSVRVGKTINSVEETKGYDFLVVLEFDADEV
jgi:hypothetical protein